MELTTEQLNEQFENARVALLETNTRFDYDRSNFSNFPNRPGVYAVYLSDELIYIGETADLRKRMLDMKNTYNHTLRKKLGKFFFPDATIVSHKYSPHIENRLNLIFHNMIKVSFIVVNFGRTEIESYLIHHHQNLLNSLSRRGRT